MINSQHRRPLDEVGPRQPGVFNPANATECGLALLEISPIDSDMSPRVAVAIAARFSPDIRTYRGAALASEGAVGAIPPFATALMPPIEPLGDPILFEAMSGQSDTYAASLKKSLWSFSENSFNALIGSSMQTGSR